MNGSKNYLGKGWDDRIGCAVLMEAMRRTMAMPHPNQLIYVATVQEEVGLRGARTAAQTVKPDIGIAIEGGIAGDTAGARPEETQAKLGAGPGMFLYDSSTIPNRKMVALVRKTAAAKGIPLQADLVQGYGDDSAEMQMNNGGTPTINLVVPVRYTHAHNGIVNRKDFDRMVDLVVDAADAAGPRRRWRVCGTLRRLLFLRAKSRADGLQALDGRICGCTRMWAMGIWVGMGVNGGPGKLREGNWCFS